MLRTHQSEFELLCQKIIAKRTPLPDFILGHVAPGGGKSALPVIAAHWLIARANLASKICWVVPNGALREQAAKAFKNTLIRNYLGHNLEINESTNSHNPSKGHVGYATTYSALACDGIGVNRREFDRSKYILVLDEFHHLPLKGDWQQAVLPLVERASLVIGMTGTLDRSDRNPIYMVPYGPGNLPYKEQTREIAWVNYSIRQATSEKAIIRVHFDHVDGQAKWYDEKGDPKEADTLGKDKGALFTALRTDYAFQLLEACWRHWNEHRKINKRSKMLVVCMDTEQAKQMLGRLRKMGVNDAEIATYRELDADESIRRFREDRSPAVLVTVAKAYEGLDVPAITHIACMTHIRSKPWIEQMLARGWRMDYHADAGSWGRQVCYAFVPADNEFRECIKAIEDEQTAAVRDIEEKERSRSETDLHDNGSVEVTPSGITPLASAVTLRWASELGGESLDADESEFYRQLAADHDLAISPLQVKKLVQDANSRNVQQQESRVDRDLETTPAQRLAALRTSLKSLIARAAGGKPEEIVRIQCMVKDRWGQRDTMEEKHLLAALEFVRKSFGSRL